MEIVSAISSPQQDGIIERILRYLNLWDPPWKRVLSRTRALELSTAQPHEWMMAKRARETT